MARQGIGSAVAMAVSRRRSSSTFVRSDESSEQGAGGELDAGAGGRVTLR